MRRWFAIILSAVLILLVGCSAAPSQAVVATAVAGTLTAQPTIAVATPTAAAPPSTTRSPAGSSTTTATPLAPVTPSPTAAAASATPTRPSTTQSPPPGIQAGCVPWREAKNYDGQTQCVCGPVIDGTYAAKSQGAPTFLNLGEKNPSPNRFTIVIWGENRANFEPAPERAYMGKVVCVTGRIKVFRGVAEVEVKSPAWIEVE